MYEINRFRRLSQALVHVVIERANLFTDHRISGLPIRAKFQYFRTILRAYLWQFSYRCHFFLFKVVIIDEWRRYFVDLLSPRNIAPHISSHDLPYHKTMKKYENSQSMEVFQFSPAEIRDSNMAL